MPMQLRCALYSTLPFCFARLNECFSGGFDIWHTSVNIFSIVLNDRWCSKSTFQSQEEELNLSCPSSWTSKTNLEVVLPGMLSRFKRIFATQKFALCFHAFIILLFFFISDRGRFLLRKPLYL